MLSAELIDSTPFETKSLGKTFNMSSKKSDENLNSFEKLICKVEMSYFADLNERESYTTLKIWCRNLDLEFIRLMHSTMY